MRVRSSSDVARLSVARRLMVVLCIGSSSLVLAEEGLQPTAHPNVKRVIAPQVAGIVTSAPSGGMVVYLDEKGRPTASPKAGISPVTLPANNNSAEGLELRPVKTKDGRTLQLMETKGRFQSFAVATVGPDGKVAVGCISPADVGASDCVTTGCKGKCCQ